ncbi:MAG: DUF4358 domain-containing protein [Clostridiales bacterium]|nr:DUF4358 domain-containing protein [Clostridiales bacterium]
MDHIYLSKSRLLSLCLLLLIALLAACTPQGKQVSLSQLYQEMEQTQVLPEMLPLDAEEAYNLIGLEYDRLAEYVVMISQNSLLADEVILIRSKDKAAADAVYELLEGRLDAKAKEARNYSPEQYAIIQKGILKREGLNLVLLVSPKVEILSEVYENNK